MTDWDYTIHCDGGKKKRQQAYGRFRIQYIDVPLDVIHVELPQAKTSNQAEYWALIKALEHLLNTLAHAKDEHLANRVSVQVMTDSLLMASQVTGLWKINDTELLKLCNKARSLLAEFRKYNVVQIDREQIVPILGC